MTTEVVFSITQTTKGKPPCLPFVRIKNTVLGKRYSLSLVFVGDRRSQTLNKKYRNNDKPANVLSFPLSKNEGEMFINQKEAQRNAKNFGVTITSFIGHLFIHGLLHLKGYQHSSKMNRQEKKLLMQFNLTKKKCV